MATEFLDRCDVIEECYEFLLGYAAQGLPTDDGSPAGREVRTHLGNACEALIGLADSCRQAITAHQLQPASPYEAFCSMLDRDVRDSLAAIELVLAQPGLSSQLIDNLNASSHLRALLTDLFLVGEILRTREKVAFVTDRA
ncbi:MAG TPA: hypothetical protein VKB49_22310 [Candidatus Sulfotelmatobacter sp.]|nr:hypothetical protein [Candidatus Sulfotelmatobacter sp.]